MDPQQLLNASYLDILFRRRNKLYGSYELRRQYPARLKRALVAVVGSAAALSSYSVVAGMYSNSPVAPPSVPTVCSLKQLPATVLEKRPKAPALPPPPPPASTVAATTTLRLVSDDSVQNSEPVLAPQVAAAGTSGPAGAGDAAGVIGGVSGGIPSGIPSGGTGGAEPPVSADPLPFAEVPPAPPFDLMAYLSERIRYPEAARETGIEGRVVLHFIVDEDGAITEVQVAKGVHALLDAEALRVVRAMPRWKPGRQGGKAVKVYFNLPVSFRLD